MNEKIKEEIINIIVIIILMLMNVVNICFYLCVTVVFLLGLAILEFYTIGTYYVIELSINKYTHYLLTNQMLLMMLILFFALFKSSLSFFKKL